MKNKSELLKKLAQQNTFLDEIIIDNSKTNLLSIDDINTLTKIKAENQEYKLRLGKDDIEIAIIGAEKAGKSTFANALINRVILPSATERCTFSSTTIEYNEQDCAEVTFYTETEFNDNFRSILKLIHYPEDKIPENFRVFSLKEFQDEILALEKQNESNMNFIPACDDVKEILTYQNDLILTGETITLISDVDKYIEGEIQNGVKNTAKPRSAKSIKIKTSNLAKFKNSIIYDVPGFDSPVVAHKEQAKRYLEKADVIIFVTDATRPSFNSNSLEILNHKGENSLPLKDKLFIFGNQIDKANNLKEAQENENKLRNELSLRGLDTGNLVVGSALRSLKENGLYNAELESLDIPGNVDKLREMVIQFNLEKRSALIKQRVEENNKTAQHILNKIIRENKPLSQDFSDDNVKDEIKEKIKVILDESLEQAKKNLKVELENKPLTESFKKIICNNMLFEPISENDLEHIAKQRSATNELSLTTLNEIIRLERFEGILQNFSEKLAHLSKNETDRVEKMIIDNLILNFEKEYQGKSSLLEELLKTFLPEQQEGEHNKFEFLFDRFSRHLFDIFAYSIASGARKEKINNAKADFLYLDHYYCSGKDNPNYSLINLLLTQHKEGISISAFRKIDKLLDELISNYTNHKTIKETVDVLKKGFSNILKSNKNNDEKENNKFDKESFIRRLIEEKGLFDIELDEIVHNNIDVNKSKSDIVVEINRDIENIKDILENAVSKAMDLELVFFNSSDNKINTLRKEFKKTSAINQIANLIIGDIDEFKANQYIKLEHLNKMKSFISLANVE